MHINYPLTYKITSFSKLKKDSEEENFIKDSLLRKKLNLKDNLNLLNLMNDFDKESIHNSANFCDIFFDGSAKFDNLSHFLKGRIYFNILNHTSILTRDVNKENYKLKVNESK